MAVPGKKWVATKAVCRTCRAPEYEVVYDCLYHRIGSKKMYSDKNEVIVYQHCFLPPHNKERSSINEIKMSDRCGPDCNKKGYKKRPPGPVPEEVPQNRTFWESVASVFVEEQSPEPPKVSEDVAPSKPVGAEVDPKTVRKVLPPQEPRPPVPGGEEIEKEKQIEGLLNTGKEQANYGEYDKAIETFEKALALDPQNRKAQEAIKKANADRSMKRWFWKS